MAGPCVACGHQTDRLVFDPDGDRLGGQALQADSDVPDAHR
jgi:hypothetical protein